MTVAMMSKPSEQDYRLVPNADAILPVLRGNDPEADADLARTLIAELDANDFTVLSLAPYCDDYAGFRDGCRRVAQTLGQLMVQNEAGDTVIEVYDRKVGRIEEGARYHQTRQGGDIHTDSVNRPEPMQYLILACASPALVGGESIMIRARDIVQRLADYPDVVEILSQPFYFESRGMSAEMQLFQMPVLSMTDSGPSFRYLRPYIQSAHIRAGQPLTPDQIYAFDVLDAFLELSTLQHRPMLLQGDLMISSDIRVFHGRTSFVDGATPGAWTKGRCMLRYWVE